MLVGVLSDTHGRLSQAAYAELADCDHIIHAGDICGPEILRELATLAPITAVLGNNDSAEYGSQVKEVVCTDLAGVRFLITHTPAALRRALVDRNGAAAPGQKRVDVAIHGHTHVPCLLRGKDAQPAQFVLCPGSVSRPRGGSVAQIAKIRIEDKVVRDISFVELS